MKAAIFHGPRQIDREFLMQPRVTGGLRNSGSRYHRNAGIALDEKRLTTAETVGTLFVPQCARGSAMI